MDTEEIKNRLENRQVGAEQIRDGMRGRLFTVELNTFCFWIM